MISSRVNAVSRSFLEFVPFLHFYRSKKVCKFRVCNYRPGKLQLFNILHKPIIYLFRLCDHMPRGGVSFTDWPFRLQTFKLSALSPSSKCFSLHKILLIFFPRIRLYLYLRLNLSSRTSCDPDSLLVSWYWEPIIPNLCISTISFYVMYICWACFELLSLNQLSLWTVTRLFCSMLSISYRFNV